MSRASFARVDVCCDKSFPARACALHGVVYMSRVIFADRRDANPRVAIKARRKKSLEESTSIMGCSRTRPIAESATFSDEVSTFASLFLLPSDDCHANIENMRDAIIISSRKVNVENEARE